MGGNYNMSTTILNNKFIKFHAMLKILHDTYNISLSDLYHKTNARRIFERNKCYVNTSFSFYPSVYDSQYEGINIYLSEYANSIFLVSCSKSSRLLESYKDLVYYSYGDESYTYKTEDFFPYFKPDIETYDEIHNEFSSVARKRLTNEQRLNYMIMGKHELLNLVDTYNKHKKQLSEYSMVLYNKQYIELLTNLFSELIDDIKGTYHI